MDIREISASRPLTRRTFLATAAVSSTALTLLKAAGPLSVGMIPDAGATQVAVDQKAPLRDYLAKALGESVNLIIPTNYNATVEALGNNSLDFAYLGALTYVKAHAMYGALPLVQRTEDKQFHSALHHTREFRYSEASPHTKGKRFAFGDINSTSGHLIPYSELKKAGVDADKDLMFRYTGSHPATAKAVESGAVDAGAGLDGDGIQIDGARRGQLDATKVWRVFYTSLRRLSITSGWLARTWTCRASREIHQRIPEPQGRQGRCSF